MTKRVVPNVSIDRDVPLPEGTTSWPISDLKVGESFAFPLEKRGSLQSSASTIKRKTGKDFTIKKIDDLTGRLWRIK